MLHSLFMTGTRPLDLTPEQVETLDLADRLTQDFFREFRDTFEIPEEALFTDSREIELTLRNASGEPLFPGHADLVRFWPSKNVRAIVDAKFGFMEVEHAADNLQLASYAVMSQQRSKADAVAVAIVQPRNFGPRISRAIYLSDTLRSAATQIQSIYYQSLEPDAPLVAGEKQCHFCKAKPSCPAYRAQFMQVEIASTRAIDTLTTDELERVHTAIQFANKIAKDVAEEMRRRITYGTLPGWKLQNSGNTVTCTDALGLYNAMRSFFEDKPEFNAAAFDSCRSMGWGKLEAIVQSVSGFTEKQTKELVKQLSEGFVDRVPNAKRVVREKGAKG